MSAHILDSARLRRGLLCSSVLVLCACGGGGEPGSGAAGRGSAPALASAAADAACSPFLSTPAYTENVPTPAAVLGFPIGAQEVTNEQASQYLAAVDGASARVVTGVAATSVQGRALPYAIVGKAENVKAAALDKLRAAARKLMDPATSAAEAASLAASTPAILWLSGNVHGNEESGADAALQVLYELAARSDCAAARILENAVVVLLPIQNPDGRAANTRRNAYGFDLNRDWFARTQPETDGKLELLRQFPPVLFVDAHEFGSKGYFFPPNADPVYHEVPKRPFDWINALYSPAIGTQMERQGIGFFHGAPYDLFAAEYGDSVPTIGFHAAGMTFEKHNGDPIAQRSREHFVAMWSSLFAAASDKLRILTQWQASHAEAYTQGVAGALQANGIYYDGKALFQQVPGAPLKHYFLRDDPGNGPETTRLLRRLQRMDVQVWRLLDALTVPDFRPYGEAPRSVTLPAGSWWVPMAQRQKHWIQALLHEDPYIPVSVSYDVTAWSNPLLMNVAGGSSGQSLAPRATLVAPLAAPALRAAPPGAPRIGLFEMPGSTSAFESAGSLRYLFDKVWAVAYRDVTAEQIKAGLADIDVLLVPDGYANAGLKALGAKGQKALVDWVKRGGRYVGWLGGTQLAVNAGVSTVALQPSHTSAPGALVRVRLDPASPLAAGVGSMPQAPSAWIMYVDHDRMTPGLGSAAATFPAPGDAAFHTSGLAIGIDELAGTAAIVDEPLGAGRSIVFSFDPNFRAWSDGTQRILWNALYGPGAATSAAAVPATVRAAAAERAAKAAKALPDVGKAIRIVVRPVDADATRALLQRYSAEFEELRKSERVVFLIENRQALSWEEHPYVVDLSRELRRQLTPISFSVP